MDTFEEMELLLPESKGFRHHASSIPTYSISKFQRLCTLAKIMTKTIDRFYIDGTTGLNPHPHFERIGKMMMAWYETLPHALHYEPWVQNITMNRAVAAPNIIILLTTYNALMILLHRPFMKQAGSGQSNIGGVGYLQ